MIKFFHHLFNPHCEECQLEKECKNCEVLRGLLEQERFENKRLLDLIIEKSRPVVEEQRKELKPEEVRPKFVPWRVRQAELEREDRHAAQLLKKKKEEIEITDLEKELDLVQ